MNVGPGLAGPGLLAVVVGLEIRKSLGGIMQKFVDRAGRIWIVDIDNTTLRRVKTLTGVHLLEAIDGDLITRLSTDPLLLGDVLYAICKPQRISSRSRTKLW